MSDSLNIKKIIEYNKIVNLLNVLLSHKKRKKKSYPTFKWSTRACVSSFDAATASFRFWSTKTQSKDLQFFETIQIIYDKFQ